jgi:Kef-type K+ transport system membrane component KefB
MENISVLLIIGSAIIITLGAGKAVKRFKLPLVVGYVLVGVILGKSFLDILDAKIIEKTSMINDLALGIIAFIIGGELNLSRLKRIGKVIASIAFFESLGTFFIVSISLTLLTGKIYYGLILGAVASATAPAATVAVINQYKARGILTNTILGVVGSDDAIALIIYAFASAISYPFIVHRSLSWMAILSPIREVFLSLLLGIISGLILSYFLNKTKSKEEMFALVIGVLLICEGIAVQLNLSELLIIMTMAIIGGNIHPRKFSLVMNHLNMIGFPLIAAFFCLAGTRLDITLLPSIGILGIVYLGSRLIGKYFGARLGAVISYAPSVVKKYIGLSLWPQIGVAVALAIMVERDFAGLGKDGEYLATLVMNILLFTTIFTEIIGPLATRYALVKAKEIKRDK